MFELTWTLLKLAFGSWVVITGWAFAIARADEIRNSDIEFTWVVTVPLYIFLVGGALANVVFNILVGSVIFKERPREWFFSDRIRRHLKNSSVTAQGWRDRINKIWPEHI